MQKHQLTLKLPAENLRILLITYLIIQYNIKYAQDINLQSFVDIFYGIVN